MTSRFWGSRNVRPSMRNRMGDMVYGAENRVRGSESRPDGDFPIYSKVVWCSSWACGDSQSHARHVITTGPSAPSLRLTAAGVCISAAWRRGNGERTSYNFIFEEGNINPARRRTCHDLAHTTELATFATFHRRTHLQSFIILRHTRHGRHDTATNHPSPRAAVRGTSYLRPLCR